MIHVANRQIQYQDIMVFAKKMTLFQHGRGSQDRSDHKIVPQAKRANSLKPMKSERTRPAGSSSHLLPPIKSYKSEDKSKQQASRDKEGYFKVYIDQRIKERRQRYLKLLPHSSSKKCIALSPEEHIQRKESHLNTYYNLRKSRLIQITKENKQLYTRINSQKSLYSSKELDKSYESNCSLSRRLSQSKLSKISSRHSIERGRPASKCEEKMPQPHNAVNFMYEVDKGQTEKVYRYMNIFCNRLNLKQHLADKQAKKTQTPRINDRYNKENNRKSPISKHEAYRDLPTQSQNRRNTIMLARLL